MFSVECTHLVYFFAVLTAALTRSCASPASGDDGDLLRSPMPTEMLDTMESHALEQLAQVQDATGLDMWKSSFLGPKGRVKQALAGVKDVAPEHRKAFGQRANEINKTLIEAFEHRRSSLGASGGGSAEQRHSPRRSSRRESSAS